MQALDCDVVDVGFISDAEDGARAAEQLRVAGCDLIVGFLTTYMTASMLVPIAQRSGAPVLLINLQPTEAMDHATFDTGQWLAYCGACPLPEMANTFLRLGVPFRSVSGLPRGRAGLGQDRPLDQGGRRARRPAHRPARADGAPLPRACSTCRPTSRWSPPTSAATWRSLEFDDLRVRVSAVTDAQVDERMALAREVFELDDTVQDEDFRWAAQVSVGLDRLAADFGLDSLAYYHRGLEGEQHERLGAGHDPGRLAADRARHPGVRRVRAAYLAGDADRRPARRRRVLHRTAGAELPRRRGRDGPRRPGAPGASASAARCCAASASITASAGWGVSVEFDVKHGPVTTFGIAQQRDGSFRFVASAGEVVPGPLLQIGNTTSRVDFGCDPGEWVDAWSATGISHHWALGVGDLLPELRATADLLGIELVEVAP